MIRTCLLSAAAALAPLAATAQTVPGDAVRAEFLDGWRTDRGTHMTALRLTLADGWKTYWRAPGEAGIPPRFDWTGSENVAGVAFHWPRPEVFELNGMRAIGYKHELVLPIEFTPADAGGGMAIAAEVELGVCQEICVPVTLSLSRPLPEEGAPDPAISAALAEVPPAGKADAIRCAVEPLRDGLRITAQIDIASAGGEEVAVVELADPTIWVSEAVTQREGGRLTTTADLVPANAKPFALDRSEVTITILGETRALELRGCPS
ncbi:protein-disulfide reductase DsbD domain-containing protein [Ostreiculturibacter nitratireducens]|uniref:protein-disulfide reductase DsbD domain-containing protein n=1 Tax=Ostreiculturibacter nitratireducens TaxID=3075226 RepID=UPI0031B57008